jgi:2-amino-4-hydroxy-6-hydroxymethyldihydropteridine diphosphokinase
VPFTPVAIAAGSNVGDRHGHLDWAFAWLKGRLVSFRQSSRILTEPVDVLGNQPAYLNAVVTGMTQQSPEDLLAMLHELETLRGRVRAVPRTPRTLDLDLIFYGNLVMNTPALVLPHPRFRQRRFVLEPLAEIAPNWVDPVTHRTVAGLLAALA